MKINKVVVNNKNGFRGLPNGFEISFRSAFNRNEIDPICLAGLNGSGKSNVIELISEIFFYLEAVHHPTAKKTVKKNTPFGFLIEYETKVTANNLLQSDSRYKSLSVLGSTRIVEIKKDPGKEIVVRHNTVGEWIKLNPENLGYDYNVSQLLPSKIVAYSSGQNELVSNPFLRMDFFYFDEYLKEQEEEGDSAEIGQNRLFYMDYDSNGLVLLSNLLMKDKKNLDEQKELNILREISDVQDIESFNLVLNLRVKKDHPTEQLNDLLENLKGLESESILNEIERQLFWNVQLPYQLRKFVERLEHCCSYSDFVLKEEGSEKWLRVTLYFKSINDDVKRAFQKKFGNGLKLFRQLYLLSLLNIYNYSDELREKVKSAKSGTADNISDLIPDLPKKDKVFYIDSLRLRKKAGGKKGLYYKNLSDGEHQFLHIIGTLMLMEEEGTIFLLDEPSTHFNPDWRSKFIHTANRIHDFRKKRVQSEDLAQQIVVISTHSPFVLSDSKSKNVIWLQKKNGKPVVKPLDFETYGASVEYIMKRIEDMVRTKEDEKLPQAFIDLIPRRAYQDLVNVINSGDKKRLRQAISEFGESTEKQLLYAKLAELKKKND